MCTANKNPGDAEGAGPGNHILRTAQIRLFKDKGLFLPPPPLHSREDSCLV